MSSLIVNVEKIEDVYKHPNADRLDIVRIKGWQCIVGRDTYKVGDKAIYIPIDSILPESVENKIFLGSKVKLSKSRVKTIKLRGTISQGLVVPPELFSLERFKVGESVAEVLGIKKYEPADKPMSMSTGAKSTKKQTNPNFKKYLKIQHLKNFPSFMNGHNVAITEKIHGCFRADTQITLFDGTQKTIKEIVDNKLDVDILGVDENGSFKKTKILNWFNNGKTDLWINIRANRNSFSNGNYFSSTYCTTNHEFFLPDLNIYKSVCDLKVGDKILQSYKSTEISSIQRDILVGKMLGDGSIHKNSIAFSHKKAHEEYVDFTLKCLGDIAGNKQSEILSGYGTVMSRGRTKSYECIGEIFSTWFEKGKKEIPNDIVLNPVSLAFWYMDDGSILHTEKQQDRLSLATCGFSKKSVLNLINSLNKSYGFNAKLSFTDGKYYRIRINKDGADIFFKIISPYICECMRYKLPKKYILDKINIGNILSDNNSKVIFKKSLENIISIIPQKNALKQGVLKYDIETETHNYFANGVLVHNSNYRVGYVKTHNRNIFHKLLSKIGLRKSYEFTYGSHNVQLQNKFLAKTYYSKNVYAEITSRYNFKKMLKKGECVYGEIYGDGIQKGYKYGLKDEIDLIVFDVKINDEFLNIMDAEKFCVERGLKFVPILCFDNFNNIDIDSFFDSPSIICEDQKVKEGIVIKSIDNYKTGQYTFKHINSEYLLKDNTDYH